MAFPKESDDSDKEESDYSDKYLQDPLVVQGSWL
jgi:hypothetical protein